VFGEHLLPERHHDPVPVDLERHRIADVGHRHGVARLLARTGSIAGRGRSRASLYRGSVPGGDIGHLEILRNGIARQP
jgi:hypothetical protein